MMPMRRRTFARKQAGLREHEGAATDRHDARSRRVGTPKRLKQRGGNFGIRPSPAGNDDCIRGMEELQSAVGLQSQSARSPEQSRFGRSRQAAIPAGSHFRAGQAKNFKGTAELEGAELIVGQDDDERAGSVWHDPYDSGKSGHLQQTCSPASVVSEGVVDPACKSHQIQD